ncbi:MAG: tetratricopeptide repeat protein [Syntrophobacteraceae bacterium]
MSLATEINHTFTIGHIEITYAWSYAAKGDGHACMDHYRQAVYFMEPLKAVNWLGQAYTGIGQACYFLGRYEEAVGYIEKGMEIQSRAGSLTWRARQYLYLGLVYLEMGDMTKASRNAEEALALARKIAEKDHEAYSKILLGRVAVREEKSRLDEAERNVLDGIRILKDQRQKPDVAVGYLSLAELYLDAGQNEKALQPVRKAEAMFREMGMDQWLKKAQEVLAKL